MQAGGSELLRLEAESVPLTLRHRAASGQRRELFDGLPLCRTRYVYHQIAAAKKIPGCLPRYAQAQYDHLAQCPGR